MFLTIIIHIFSSLVAVAADTEVITVRFVAPNTFPYHYDPTKVIDDHGDIYGTKNNYTYGWNIDHRSQTVYNDPGGLSHFDGSCSFRPGGKWEIALTNGRYKVEVHIGDLKRSAVNSINAEGYQCFVDFPSAVNDFWVFTPVLDITDGRLTITNTGGTDGYETRISYVIISRTTDPLTPPIYVSKVILNKYNGSVVSGTSVNLSWQSDAIANKYQVQVAQVQTATDTNFTYIEADSNVYYGTSAFFLMPDDGTLHYYVWRVRAGNDKGWGPWSDVDSFKNGPSAVPDKVSLQDPPNGSNVGGTYYHLSWRNTARTTQYQVQVAYDNAFTNCIEDLVLGKDAIGIPITLPDDGSKVYWHVRAGNSLGWGSWSDIYSFTNGPSTPPDLVSLVSPVYGANASGLKVRLIWASARKATKYQVQVALSNSFSPLLINQEYSKSPTYLDLDTLDNEAVIYWRVRAGNTCPENGGWGDWSLGYFTNGPSATPAKPVLKTPANYNKVAGTTVQFAWEPALRASNYYLQVALDSSFTRLLYNNPNLGNVLTAGISGFPNDGHTFYWRVGAFNALGWSGWSDCFEFINEQVLLQPPSGLRAVSGPAGGVVTLSWNISSESNLHHYRIYVGTMPGQYGYSYDNISPSVSNSCTIFDLQMGLRYYFAVAAVTKEDWESSYSNEASAIPESYDKSQPPTVPQNLVVSNSQTGKELKLQWQASTDNDSVAFYQIFRSTNNPAVDSNYYDARFPADTTQTSFMDEQVSLGNTYYYRVWAVDSYGNRSELSLAASGTPGDTLAPQAPTAFSTVAGSGCVDLTWQQSTKNTDGSACTDLAGYNIYRSQNSGQYGSEPFNGANRILTNYYTDISVAQNAEYFYIVKAVDKSGNESLPSQEVRVNIAASDNPPAAPQGVTILKKPAELNIQWQRVNESDMLGYNIYRSTTSGNYSSPALNSSPLFVPTYTDTAVDPTQTYYYIVRAVDYAGQESVNSQEVSGKVGEGAVWLLAPTMNDKATLDFSDTPSPKLNISYHLDPGYLSLYAGFITVELEIIESITKQSVIKLTDSSPCPSTASSDPFFLWDGKDLQKVFVKAGEYDIKLSIYSRNSNPTIAQVWDLEEKAIRVKDKTSIPFTKLETNFELPDGHWLPNDNTAIQITNIEIWGKDDALGKVVIADEYRDIKLLAPVDQYWSAADADPTGIDPNKKNNINTNKGNCKYLLYARIGGQKIEIAKFSIDLSATKEEESFKIDEYCRPAFNADGTANNDNGYYFQLIKNQDKNILNLKNNNGSTAVFYLQAIADAQTTIRPGDDMLLRFTLANYEKQITSSAKANDGSFIATYDKKLLWRANLYLNERTSENDRAHDWNDLNLWKAPLAENDWNKASYSSDVPADGNQVIIPYSFTWIRDNNYTNRVAYEFNGQDNPFEYNVKMYNQQKILWNYYDGSGNYTGILGLSNPFPPATHWSVYTAPPNNTAKPKKLANDHSYYMFGNSYPYSIAGSDPDARRVAVDNVTSNNYMPYVPGLSMSYYRYNGGNLVDDGRFAGWSAGTDCVAFVQKSAGYPHSPYLWFNNPDHTNRTLGPCFWGSSRGAASYPHVDGACWTISNKGNPLNLDKVIPGDILYYIDEPKHKRHLALVQNVVYNEGSRATGIKKIYLIESVYGNDYYDTKETYYGAVVNYRTIDSYNDMPWVVARLIINN